MELKEFKQVKLKGGNRKIMKTKNKQEKGITLIALVITIVVLLILAGVSINAIFSDNGIIKRAQEAQNKMDEAQQNDLKAINDLNEWIDTVSKSEPETTVIDLTGTSWKIPTNAFISSSTEGCYVLDLTIKKVDGSGTTSMVAENYISTYLRYYTGKTSGLVLYAGGSLNNDKESQTVKYLDFSTKYQIIIINGGRDANNKTLADWLSANGENITNTQ